MFSAKQLLRSGSHHVGLRRSSRAISPGEVLLRGRMSTAATALFFFCSSRPSCRRLLGEEESHGSIALQLSTFLTLYLGVYGRSTATPRCVMQQRTHRFRFWVSRGGATPQLAMGPTARHGSSVSTGPLLPPVKKGGGMLRRAPLLPLCARRSRYSKGRSV